MFGFISRYLDRRKRRMERNYARDHGYFWIPCPVCGVPFGGHEVVDDEGSASFTYVDGQMQVICFRCTYDGRGVAAPMDESIAQLEALANEADS